MRLPVQSPNVIETNPMDFGMDADMSAWDDLSPFQTYLADSFAKGAKNRGLLDQRMKRALMGETLEEQDQTDFQKKAAENAFSLAQEAANMDDAEYDDLKRQLKGMVSQRPQMPGMPKLQTPNAAALGVAGIGALLNPQFGSQIAATPFQEGLRQQEQGYQQSMLGYQDELAGRQEEMKLLESQMDDARADRQTRINAAIKLAELAQQDAQFATKEANDIESVKTTQAGLTERAKLNDRTRMFSTLWKGASASQRKEILEKYGYDPDFIAAFNQLTPQEQNIEARTADTKDKTLDRQMTRPLRMKKVQADIDASISRAQLNDENRRLIGIKADYYDDEFALKKWDREIKAENARIYRQNVESLASTRGMANPSELRQALNSERLVVSELLSLNQAQLKTKPDDAGLLAEQADLKAQLYDINQKMNPERGGKSGEIDIGAPGFGLVKPFDPMGGGVRLEGNIGGDKPVPDKPVPGNPVNKKKTPKTYSSGKGSAKVTVTKID